MGPSHKPDPVPGTVGAGSGLGSGSTSSVPLTTDAAAAAPASTASAPPLHTDGTVADMSGAKKPAASSTSTPGATKKEKVDDKKADDVSSKLQDSVLQMKVLAAKAAHLNPGLSKESFLPAPDSSRFTKAATEEVDGIKTSLAAMVTDPVKLDTALAGVATAYDAVYKSVTNGELFDDNARLNFETKLQVVRADLRELTKEARESFEKKIDEVEKKIASKDTSDDEKKTLSAEKKALAEKKADVDKVLNEKIAKLQKTTLDAQLNVLAEDLANRKHTAYLSWMHASAEKDSSIKKKFRGEWTLLRGSSPLPPDITMGAGTIRDRHADSFKGPADIEWRNKDEKNPEFILHIGAKGELSFTMPNRRDAARGLFRKGAGALLDLVGLVCVTALATSMTVLGGRSGFGAAANMFRDIAENGVVSGRLGFFTGEDKKSIYQRDDKGHEGFVEDVELGWTRTFRFGREKLLGDRYTIDFPLDREQINHAGAREQFLLCLDAIVRAAEKTGAGIQWDEKVLTILRNRQFGAEIYSKYVRAAQGTERALTNLDPSARDSQKNEVSSVIENKNKEDALDNALKKLEGGRTERWKAGEDTKTKLYKDAKKPLDQIAKHEVVGEMNRRVPVVEAELDKLQGRLAKLDDANAVLNTQLAAIKSDYVDVDPEKLKKREKKLVELHEEIYSEREDVMRRLHVCQSELGEMQTEAKKLDGVEGVPLKKVAALSALYTKLNTENDASVSHDHMDLKKELDEAQKTAAEAKAEMSKSAKGPAPSSKG